MRTLFILSIAVLFFVLASLQVDGKRHISEDFAGRKTKVTSVGRKLIAKNSQSNANKVNTDEAAEKSTNGRTGPEVDDDSNESYGSSGSDLGSSSENHHNYANDQRPSPKNNDNPKKKVPSVGRQLIAKDLQNNQNKVNTDGDEDSNESFGSSGSGLGSSSVNQHYFTDGRKPQNPGES